MLSERKNKSRENQSAKKNADVTKLFLPYLRSLRSGRLHELTRLEALVLMVLISRADNDLVVWSSARRINKDLGTSSNRIYVALRGLTEKGFLETIEHGRERWATTRKLVLLDKREEKRPSKGSPTARDPRTGQFLIVRRYLRGTEPRQKAEHSPAGGIGYSPAGGIPPIPVGGIDPYTGEWNIP